MIALVALWASAGCRTVTDPPLPSGAQRFTAPTVFARWWALTEGCSGLTRDFGSVQWYTVPGVTSFPLTDGKEANGYYSEASGEIVLANGPDADPVVVRHEMLHALLRNQRGHPRGYFLERCAGVVTCQPACRADAGPPPPNPAGTVIVAPSALQVAAELSPATPSASTDGGWFTLTVTATNAGTTPVQLAFAPGAPITGFGYEMVFDPPAVGNLETNPPFRSDDYVTDPNDLLFAPGETKRYIFDLRAGTTRGLFPPRTYVYRGALGGVGVGPTTAARRVTVVP